jgi:site-specific recombinase XerD
MNQEPIKNYLDPFSAELKSKDRSPSTILAYNSDLNQLLKYLAKHNVANFDQLTQAHLDNFRDWLITKKYTTKTVSRKLNAIKTFFRWLKDTKVINYDPSDRVEHPTIKNGSPKFLSPLEYRALRDVSREDTRTSAMVEIILQTGLRISEVSNLKLSDIKKNKIIVQPYATQSRREVHLNSRTRETINKWLKDRPETELEYLFISVNGNKLAVRNIRASIDRFMQRADIQDYSVNDLRNTFIVENLKRGVDINVVARAAGHKRLSTTERYLALAEIKQSGRKQQLEEI